MSPWLLATFGLAAASMGLYAVGYRRRYQATESIVLWKHLHALTGLAIEKRGGDAVWLVWLLLDPILFIWGDLRSRRPERLLRSWCLAGPNATITLDAEQAHLGVTCTQPVWTDPGRPLAEQEGLRCLHPIGAPRWNDGVALVEKVLAPGPNRLRYVGGKLVVDARHTAADAGSYPAILTAMSELASFLEAR